MPDEFPSGSAGIRRRVRAWQIIIFGGLIWGIVTVNALSVLSDAMGHGHPLPVWQPFVWEYSSAIVTIALIPCVAWLGARFAVGTSSWKRTMPLHLVATLTAITSLSMHQGKSYPLRESLAALEKKLDPRHFARVHRGRIVNLDRIKEIQPWDSGDYRILLLDGSFVNFSRRYRSRLPQFFGS